MNNRLAPAFLIVGSLLTACNGGGGNTGMTPAPVQFTSFSAVQNGQSVPANGFSQTMTIGPFATTLDPVNTANSTAQFTYINIGTAAPVISAFSFSTPTSSAGFASMPIDCTSVAGECSASGTNSLGKVINALDSSVGWNYQTFGYWLVNLSTLTRRGRDVVWKPYSCERHSDHLERHLRRAQRRSLCRSDRKCVHISWQHVVERGLCCPNDRLLRQPYADNAGLDRSIAATCWRARSDRHIDLHICVQSILWSGHRSRCYRNYAYSNIDWNRHGTVLWPGRSGDRRCLFTEGPRNQETMVGGFGGKK